jgi:hypothetical protein
MTLTTRLKIQPFNIKHLISIAFYGLLFWTTDFIDVTGALEP